MPGFIIKIKSIKIIGWYRQNQRTMKQANQIGWMKVSQALNSNLFASLKQAKKLKYAILVSIAVLMCSTAFTQAVALIEISGTVVNQEKNAPLPK